MQPSHEKSFTLLQASRNGGDFRSGCWLFLIRQLTRERTLLDLRSQRSFCLGVFVCQILLKSEFRLMGLEQETGLTKVVGSPADGGRGDPTGGEDQVVDQDSSLKSPTDRSSKSNKPSSNKRRIRPLPSWLTVERFLEYHHVNTFDSLKRTKMSLLSGDLPTML